MKQYTLRLDKTRQRPVVILNNGLTALFDTGAYIPVWTDDEDILISELGAVLVRGECAIIWFWWFNIWQFVSSKLRGWRYFISKYAHDSK